MVARRKHPIDHYALLVSLLGWCVLCVAVPDATKALFQGKWSEALAAVGTKAVQTVKAAGNVIAPGQTGEGFDAFYQFSRQWEGGYSNHPADSGGSTQSGVTQATYDSYRASQGLVKQDVKSILEDEVKAIYRQRWEAGNCGNYAAPLSIVCGDTWVNFNPDANHAGWFFKDLDTSDPMKAALEVVKRRMEYRRQRASEKPSQQAFLEGWLNRDRALQQLVEKI